jgi:hypothetical protein
MTKNEYQLQNYAYPLMEKTVAEYNVYCESTRKWIMLRE